MKHKPTKKMSFAKLYNKVTFSVNTEGFEYCKLKDLYEPKAKEQKTHVLNGLFVNKSPLGESPVFICAELKKLVNIPSHLADTCKTILSDCDAVQAIEEGKVGFYIYSYEARGKECYSIRFVDL